MPVRSLTSAVLKWPDREEVLAAARSWATNLCRNDETVVRVACVGSYARGDRGVGSDLDVIVILRDTRLPASLRYAKYYPDGLPVPADLWVYTEDEWESLATRSPLLKHRLDSEMLDLIASS